MSGELGRSIAVLALCALNVGAQAQAWPAKPIRIIVPFTPGSGTDIMARTVTERLSPQLGQPIVIENRPGAGGTIGAAVVAKSEPDGYTLFVHSSSYTVTPSTYKDLPYDTLRDLDAPQRRALSSRRRHRHRQHPFQGLAGSAHRDRHRPRRFLFLPGQRDIAAPEGRQARRPRGGEHEALARASRASHHAGGRRSRLRLQLLGRHVRAGEDAARRRETSLSGDGEGAAHARSARKDGAPRRRVDGLRPRAVQRLHPR